MSGTEVWRIISNTTLLEAMNMQEALTTEADNPLSSISYEAWKTAHLQDTIFTTSKPNSDVTWISLAKFTPDVPGADPDWGDEWYRGEIDSVPVYRLDSGMLLSIYYGPSALVHQWCEAKWGKLVGRYGTHEAARIVLMLTIAPPVEGEPTDESPYARLVETEGIDHYIALARADEWQIPNFPGNYDLVEWYVDTAHRYEIPYVLMEHIANGGDVETVQRLNLDIDSFWRHPVSGRLFILRLSHQWIDIMEVVASIEEARALLMLSLGES
jgi:hypothetical protein